MPKHDQLMTTDMKKFSKRCPLTSDVTGPYVLQGNLNFIGRNFETNEHFKLKTFYCRGQ